MIEVFRTNVTRMRESKQIKDQLLGTMPGVNVHFDLDDCDRILRVENMNGPVDASRIIELVRQTGFQCEVLND